jgi:hypothetical protein
MAEIGIRSVRREDVLGQKVNKVGM